MASVTKIWFLKRIHLFENLSDVDLRLLDERSRMAQVPRRKLVFDAGQPGDAVYLLKSGRVKLSRVHDDRELMLAILEPGEVFGETAVLSDAPHETRAEVMEDAAICIIGKRDFEEMLSRRPQLSIRLTKLIGLRFHRIETRLHDLLYCDVTHCLARLLLDLAEDIGEPDADGATIHIRARLTHRDLSNLIASTRETVSLTLGQLRDKGLIDFDRRTLSITDAVGLRAILGH